MITLIYAQDRHGGIGYKNQMPWHLPNDLAFFKAQTLNQTIVMGRLTFESLGKRLLPNRRSIVISTQANYGHDIEGLTVIHQLEDILQLSQKEDLYIIGGAQLYQEMLPYADRIIRTVIDEEFTVDTYAPVIDLQKWQCVQIQQGIQNEKNKFAHQFEWWQRKEELS